MPNLSQLEADMLFNMPKYPQAVGEHYIYPTAGNNITVPLISVDEKEEFLLDIGKGRIALKTKYQTRGRKTFILARLDLNGAPHRNPDGQEISGTHLHLYKEGYEDKWAFSVDVEKFPNLDDLWETLHDFMGFCRIVQTPIFDKELF